MNDDENGQKKITIEGYDELSKQLVFTAKDLLQESTRKINLLRHTIFTGFDDESKHDLIDDDSREDYDAFHDDKPIIGGLSHVKSNQF